MPSATAGWTPRPAGSTTMATRIGRTGGGPSNGTSTQRGSRGSPADSARKATRRSRTRRANGPFTAINCEEIGRVPLEVPLKDGTRPKVGRMPATPLQ